MATYRNCLAYATDNVISGDDAVKVCDVLDSILEKEVYKSFSNKEKFICIKYMLFFMLYGGDDQESRKEILENAEKSVLEAITEKVEGETDAEKNEKALKLLLEIDKEIKPKFNELIDSSEIKDVKRLDLALNSTDLETAPVSLITEPGGSLSTKDLFNYIGVCIDEGGAIHFYRVLGLYLNGFGIVGTQDALVDNITLCQAKLDGEKVKVTQYSPYKNRELEFDLLGFIKVEKRN